MLIIMIASSKKAELTTLSARKFTRWLLKSKYVDIAISLAWTSLNYVTIATSQPAKSRS